MRLFMFSMNLIMSRRTLSAERAVSYLLVDILSSISSLNFLISCWRSMTAFLFTMSKSTLWARPVRISFVVFSSSSYDFLKFAISSFYSLNSLSTFSYSAVIFSITFYCSSTIDCSLPVYKLSIAFIPSCTIRFIVCPRFCWRAFVGDREFGSRWIEPPPAVCFLLYCSPVKLAIRPRSRGPPGVPVGVAPPSVSALLLCA